MSHPKDGLQIALTILQQAGAADLAGDTAGALPLYVSAASRLEMLIPNLPGDHANVVQQHLEGIRQRAEVLRTEKSRKTTNLSYPSFPQPFQHQSIPLDEGRHAVPHATVLRPYWLMQTLSKSMQLGAFVTPDLYICKDVWYQEGAAAVVTYVGPKVRFLSAICDALEPLQRVTSLSEKKPVIKVLETFLRTGDSAKSLFDSEVGKSKGNATIAQRSRVERGVWEFLHKGQSMLKNWKSQQDASYNSYVAWSVNVLEQAQILHRWTQYFLQGEGAASFPEVLERLHNISAFLYYSVCSFLIQDMMLLTERFTDKSRESVSRFLPVDVKVED